MCRVSMPSLGLITAALGRVLFLLHFRQGLTARQYGDAEHITAILGESVVLNCPVSMPEVSHLFQWHNEHFKIPIYIWYEGYGPHIESSYMGRISKVNPSSNFGLASINLTNARESDQGWYKCVVYYLDRTGYQDNNTWIHLDVHAPPRFDTTPENITYVNIGDSIILNCEAEGTPKPEIFWYRDNKSVVASDTIGIFNDGTELRISKIRDKDIGDYVCIARNAEGKIHHEAKVVIAGGAVIINPPKNQTRLESEKAEFTCEAKALPGNVTVSWKRDDVPIENLSWLNSRSTLRRDGTLVINPTSADDTGFFTCEVSNGIGTPQTATAYLNVEYPARVSYTPTVQYLPFRQQGIIKCYVKSNPPLQFVTWLKDRRMFDPESDSAVTSLRNGSLLITRVLVREPPMFSPRPQAQYHGHLGEEVTFVCSGKGTPTPEVTWRRRDGLNLPRERIRIDGGNLTILNLQKSDHAFYECEVKNEILAIVSSTQLLVEGTTPHPPYNVTTKSDAFSITLSWLPGYPGGKEWEQEYTIWYRIKGKHNWSQIDVKPEGSTRVTIHNLTPDTTYEFQIQGRNKLGDGMFTEIITASTSGGGVTTRKPPEGSTYDSSAEYDYGLIVFPTDSSGSTYFPTIINSKGPKPGSPVNVTIKALKEGYVISWHETKGPVPVTHYDIEYKTDATYKALNKEEIVGETSYKRKKYTFRVIAKTPTSYQASEEIVYSTPVHNKEKAITAALVGGILFFIVAIILSVCTVKICNRRKRRKQEKAYNMVACRVSDARNGGHAASPVPLKKFLWNSISVLRDTWTWFKTSVTGHGVLDTTDSRPLDSSSPSAMELSRTEEFRSYGVERHRKFPKDVKYTVKAEYTQPLGWISRSRDGRFILDQDSDEGGFTSPRHSPSRVTPTGILDTGFLTSSERGIESGVYHVREGITSHLDHPPPTVPRLSLRSNGSGGTIHRLQVRKRPRAFYPSYYYAPTSRLSIHTIPEGAEYISPHYQRELQHRFSPQFGQHVIPESPQVFPQFTSPRRFRTSSPEFLSPEWSQWAHLMSFSDVSSVRQPSSAERSFPSTVLSSFPNSSQDTPSGHGTFIMERAHSSADILSPQRIYPVYTQELPVLMPMHQAVAPAHTIHVVDTQVHLPHQTPFARIPRTVAHPLPDHRWVAPRRPVYIKEPFTGHSRVRVQYHHPPYRERIGHIQPPRIPDIPRHYVNLPPKPIENNEIGPDWETKYLLKPLPRETQKPLATSSPPRPRSRTLQQYKPSGSPLPDLDRSLKLKLAKKSLVSQSEKRIPKLPHKDQLALTKQVTKSDQDQRSIHETSQDLSQEQSPDSSGIGSKNTSQQQSSSQSGSGLDSSRLETTDTLDRSQMPSVSWETTSQHRHPYIISQHPPSYEQWLARHILPNLRYPFATPTTMEARMPLLIRVPRFRQRRVGAEMSSPRYRQQQLTIATPSISQPQTLDVSVDDHYEFDTVLSPTPGDDSAAIWSRSRIPSEERGGPEDSELLSEQQQQSQMHESMEARVAAMKQEFHEYRQRQARRRRSRELESIC